MSASLELATINIDGRKHFDETIEFLKDRRPHAVCVQEICEVDLHLLETCGYTEHLYVPMTLLNIEGEVLNIGFAIFFDPSVDIISKSLEYYVGSKEDPVVELDDTNMATRLMTEKRGVAIGKVMLDGVEYTIATTHFNWVPGGVPDENQARCVQKLLAIVRQVGEVVLCGDFNAARGGPIFDAIAQELKDNIPLTFDTSIDPDIHRVKGLRTMVDGIFSTPQFRVSSVRMTFGISDHAVITCRVARV